MIVGREKEQAILMKLFHSKKAEFLAIYGRRRIGKTFLIHEFFKDKGICLEITGSNKAPKKEQLRNFFNELSAKFPQFDQRDEPDTWTDAFKYLKELIQNIKPSIKFVLFIDELPWLASPKSGFLSALDYLWNRHLSRLPNVFLIVCGSSAHWIIKKIINDKGGLHGRLSAQIPLQAFTLSETEQFLGSQDVRLKRKQIVEIYMALGGVAKYLTNIPTAKSPAQIINELCFSPAGLLFAEFSKLYKSLFNSADKHIAIVRVLAKKHCGMTKEELLEATHMTKGGGATDILHELEEAGFIMSIPAFGKSSKNHLFRLVDEYSLFYLNWIEGVKGSVLKNFDAEYWNKMSQTQLWHVWAGHAFENVCLKHAGKIKEALGLGGVMTKEGYFKQKASKRIEGAEIDLIIDRADNCINLCEIKFCKEEFIVSKSYCADLERKKRVFQQVTGTKKTVFLTMITPFGIKETENTLGVIDQQLTLDVLF